MSQYESHVGLFDMEKPFRFHLNRVERSNFYAHWHENIELLYVIGGSAQVITDRVAVPVHVGQIAVINSNHLHNVVAEDFVEYYCLIIDKNFLESFGFDVEETVFERMAEGPELTRCFQRIVREYTEEKEHYKEQIKADILSVMVELTRHHTVFQQELTDPAVGRKLAVVKEVLRYLKKQYKEPVSLQDIADAVGFNKYYISHLFKEMVGCPIVYYINDLRCNYAKSLLISEQYTVSEVAEMCGFDNLSYFSRTYKRHMCVLPRDQKDAK
ncbi:MAG: AraC family transcriptional regulator [Clostridia bacterium]